MLLSPTFKKVFYKSCSLLVTVSKQIEISKESVQRFLQQTQENLQAFFDRVVVYFSHLDLYQLIAWGAIGLGFIFVVVSLFVW